MGNKYLSDVLSGEDIIKEECQRICIISGVGSGKNTFVEKELSRYGNILYISSRRAKVDEILENKICNNTINWNNYGNDVVAVTAQFASTDCPFRMSGAGSSVEAVWVFV